MHPSRARQIADALEDDYVHDDLVALSGDEDAGDLVPDDDESGDVSGGSSPEEGKTQEADAAASAKKRKRREKEKERKAKKVRMFETAEPIRAISVAAAPPLELSDYLCSKQIKTFSKLSDIELSDMRIPESAIADTTMWTGERTLDQLVDFISKALPTLRTRLAQKPKNNGAPTLIVISGSALRVADAVRILKDKRLRGEKGGDVAKLFAKHFKLEDHVSYLRRTKLAVAVGTPGRIGKLLTDTDALGVTALSHVLLDVSHLDAKKRSLLDIPENRDEVFKYVLGAPKLLNAVKQGKVQIVLF